VNSQSDVSEGIPLAYSMNSGKQFKVHFAGKILFSNIMGFR